MSHDLSIVLRRGGQLRCTHERMGGSALDATLQRGPAAILAEVETMRSWQEPFTHSYLSGIALVDLDEHHLLWWGSQLASDRAPALRRYLDPLLERAWPGWSVRFAWRGILDFAAVLGELPELAGARAEASLLSGARADELTAGLLLDAEPWDECRRWLTVRAASGVLHHCLVPELGEATVLQAGPSRLEQVCRQAPGTWRPQPSAEGDLAETAFVDVASRRVSWWADGSRWICRPAFCDPLWPGWTLVHDAGGPRSHAARGGLSGWAAPPEVAVETTGLALQWLSGHQPELLAELLAGETVEELVRRIG